MYLSAQIRDGRFATLLGFGDSSLPQDLPPMGYMKTFALSFLAFPALVLAAAPQIAAPQESCSNIQWSPDFLKTYPKAPAACRDVTVKDGVKYARFDGVVAKVGHNYVQVTISDVADIPISTIAFQIGVGGTVTIGDKTERVKDLRLKDRLTFWVREGQFGISPTLADKPMPIIQPDAMTNN